MIRAMTIDDYDQVKALWMTIHGFGIRSVDDSREGIEMFLKRNPGMSVVAIEDDRVVGAILCGHDGRRGCRGTFDYAFARARKEIPARGGNDICRW